jgi:hypothetical protein
MSRILLGFALAATLLPLSAARADTAPPRCGDPQTIAELKKVAMADIAKMPLSPNQLANARFEMSKVRTIGEDARYRLWHCIATIHVTFPAAGVLPAADNTADLKFDVQAADDGQSFAVTLPDQ